MSKETINIEAIGIKLKKIRLEKGLSLEEAHKKTKIHLKILRAIEGDGLTNLNPVYLKGFLKIYCKFLGVELKDYILLQKETKELPVKQEEEIKEPKTQEKKKDSPSILETVSVKLGSLRPNKKTKSIFLWGGAILLSAVLLFNLGKFISAKRKSRAMDKKSAVLVVPKKEKIKPQKAQPEKAPEKPKPEKVVSPPKKETASGIRLVIRARENCWVYLKSDGRVVFQRVLEKNRFETWQAKEKIELSLGNAGGVELEVNGQVFSNLGKRGQARKNIIITKDGLNIGK